MKKYNLNMRKNLSEFLEDENPEMLAKLSQMNNWTERILKLEYQVEKLASSRLDETKIVSIATDVVKTCQRSIEEM